MHSFRIVLLMLVACVFGVTAKPEGLGAVSPYQRSEAGVSHLAHAQTKRMERKRMTNSERLAQGLTPLRPRKLYDASRSDTAARARRSAGPTCSQAQPVMTCCDVVVAGEGFKCYNPGTVPAGGCTISEIAVCCESVVNNSGTDCMPL